VSSIPLDQCVKKISSLHKSFDKDIVAHTIRAYTVPSNEGANVVAINTSKLTKIRAKQLLRLSKNWRTEEFMKAWQDTVPDEITVTAEFLKGEAITETFGLEERLKYFPASDLPSNPQERFSVLFVVKTKWTLEEILPYLRDLTRPGCTEEQLLLRYARLSFGPGNTKLYSTRL